MVFRRDLDPAAWDAFVAAHARGWFFHTTAWLDYCLAYNEAAQDHSFAAVSSANEVKALYPLILEGTNYSTGGQPGASPLFDGGVSLGHVFAPRTVEASRWLYREHPVEQIDPNALRDWPKATDRSWETFVVDLSQPKATLWRNVRKSYKSLINQANGELLLGTTRHPSEVYICHALHAEVSGRETRPQTWSHWEQWARDGHLVMAVAHAHVADVGFAAAIVYKDWAYYASAATLAPDIAHALQWALMLRLKQDGVRYYELGWAERPGDTAKDKAISFFKSGFGGTPWVVPAVELRLRRESHVVAQ